jgi:hypothetical protein
MSDKDLEKFAKLNNIVNLTVELCEELNLDAETVIGENSMVRTLVDRKLKDKKTETKS